MKGYRLGVNDVAAHLLALNDLEGLQEDAPDRGLSGGGGADEHNTVTGTLDAIKLNEFLGKE